VTVREQSGIAAVLSHGQELGQETFGALRRSFERFFGPRPNFLDRTRPSTHLHSYSPSVF
jgi:hypothetical protein